MIYFGRMRMMMKKMKSNLDERQEQAMLKIERNGCWLAFWGLFIVMIIEYITFGYQDLRAVAGEWIVFMILAIYIAIDCTKSGIFDRRLKPTAATFVVCSIVGGLVAGLILGIVQYRRYPEFPGIAAAMGCVIGVITAGLIFLSLAVCAKKIKDQEKRANAEYDDQE